MNCSPQYKFDSLLLFGFELYTPCCKILTSSAFNRTEIKGLYGDICATTEATVHISSI